MIHRIIEIEEMIILALKDELDNENAPKSLNRVSALAHTITQYITEVERKARVDEIDKQFWNKDYDLWNFEQSKRIAELQSKESSDD